MIISFHPIISRQPSGVKFCPHPHKIPCSNRTMGSFGSYRQQRPSRKGNNSGNLQQLETLRHTSSSPTRILRNLSERTHTHSSEFSVLPSATFLLGLRNSYFSRFLCHQRIHVTWMSAVLTVILVLHYGDGVDFHEVLSIRRSGNTSEIFIELSNKYVGDCVELLGNKFKALKTSINAKLLSRHHRSGPHLDDAIDLWGFSNHTSNQSVETAPFWVKRLVHSSRTRDCFPRPGYFASLNLTDGSKTFLEINFKILQVRAIPRLIVASDDSSSSLGRTRQPHNIMIYPLSISKDARLYAGYLGQIDNKCLEN